MNFGFGTLALKFGLSSFSFRVLALKLSLCFGTIGYGLWIEKFSFGALAQVL